MRNARSDIVHSPNHLTDFSLSAPLAPLSRSAPSRAHSVFNADNISLTGIDAAFTWQHIPGLHRSVAGIRHVHSGTIGCNLRGCARLSLYLSASGICNSGSCWKSFAETDIFVTDLLRDMLVHYAFGPFRFDAGGLLTRKEKQVHLTPKEAGVLRVFLENAGSVVEKEEFQKKVWPEIHLDVQFDNCLKRAIATLRNALGDLKNRSHYIRTLSKRGYIFTAKVTIMPDAVRGRIKMVVLPFRSPARGKYPKGLLDGLTEDVNIQL